MFDTDGGVKRSGASPFTVLAPPEDGRTPITSPPPTATRSGGVAGFLAVGALLAVEPAQTTPRSLTISSHPKPPPSLILGRGLGTTSQLHARHKPGDWEVLRWNTLVLPLRYRCSTVVLLEFPRLSSLVLPMQSHGDSGRTTLSPPCSCVTLTAMVAPLFKQNPIFPGTLSGCLPRWGVPGVQAIPVFLV